MEVNNVLAPKAPSPAMSKAAAARPQAAERYRVVTADTALFGCAQPEEDCGIYQNDIASDRQKIWERLLAQCQETLRKDCSGVNLQFADMDTGKLPLLSTDGVQIIISKGFLERLASTKEAYDEGCAFIKDLWSQLKQVHQSFAEQNTPTGVTSVIKPGGDILTTLWPRISTPRDDYTKSFMEGKTVSYYKEKGGRNVTEIKTANGVIRFVYTKRLGYRPGRDLARLAQAANVGNVRMISGGVQAAIRRAKSDRYLDEDEVRQAVAQMQGVVRRAKAKISQLRREEILENRAKQAAKQGERRRALEMARELKQQRLNRKAKEYAQIHHNFLCPTLPSSARTPREAALAAAGCLGGGPVSSLTMETTTTLPDAGLGLSAGLDQSV